ncbi:MAG TPA: alginate lyase family protein [Polyangia bacterium]
MLALTLTGAAACAGSGNGTSSPDGAMPEGGASGSGGEGGSGSGSGGGRMIGSGGAETGGANGSGGDSGSGGVKGAGGVVGSGGASGSGGAAGSNDGGGSGGAGAMFAGPFRHPGAVLNGDQITLLKMHITAGDTPWSASLKQLQATAYGKSTYTPAGSAPPGGIVTCGYISSPDVGCTYEKNVAAGAIANALAWVLTGTKANADAAVRILNGWAATMKGRSTPAAQELTGNTGDDFNGILQSGWQGSTIARAAELIRGSDGGASAAWAAADIAKFQTMLRTTYIPYVENGYVRTAATDPARLTGGNWDLSATDGLLQLAVFLDDVALFNKGLALWRRRVPAYIYMTADGPDPNKVPGDLVSWYTAITTVDGLAEETCRDLSHVQYGFAAMINGAETALIQGVNLYGEQAARIVAGLELNAKYWLAGSSLPAPCAKSDAANFSANYIARPTWVIAYNEFADRLKMSLPNLKTVVGQNTPPTADDTHHIQWEALTHAGVGAVGIR